MLKPEIPESLKNGLELYLEHGIEPGSFLMACLENDLREAFGRADHLNILCLGDIVCYLWHEIPVVAWGNRETVQAWMKARREAAQTLVKES